MEFLFIASWLGPVGGTETLIARMSNWLLAKGHKVTLLANSAKACRPLMPRSIVVKELGGRFFDLCFCQAAERTFSELQLGRPDVIKSFDLPASWIASVLSAQIYPPSKVVFGNYYPYLVPRSRNPLKHATSKLFLSNLRRNYSDESILCMSREQISEFQRHYGSHRNPRFWPLPVEDPSLAARPRAPEFGHIVSIGRLAPMKEYNLYMIDIIGRLREKGFPARWTVYGEGEFSDPMKSRVAALGLGEAIQLKGNLPYSEFAEALHNAYLFVGMGTASIEAALCGVPTVVALAHDTSGVTYGPLHQFNFGNVGERMETAPALTVETELKRLLQLSPPDYEQEVTRNRQYARRYEMDATMQRFLDLVEGASPSRRCAPLYYTYYLHHAAKQLVKRRKSLKAVHSEGIP